MHHTRKNSGDSTSSHGTDEAVPNKDDKMVLQKKLKTLKDAYVKERDARQSFEKQFTDLKKKFDTLDLVNSEKENKLIKLQTELSAVEEKLRSEQNRAETLKAQLRNQQPGPTTGMSGFFDAIIGGGPKKPMTTSQTSSDDYVKLKSEYQKILEDYNVLRKNNDVHLDKLSKADADKENAKKEVKDKLEEVKRKLAETEKVVEAQRQELTSNAKEIENLSQIIKRLSKEKENLEEELHTLQRKFESVTVERDQLYNSDQEKMHLLNDINETCMKMEGEIKELSGQKVESDTEALNYKRELDRATEDLLRLETQLQTFNIKKVTKVMELPTQLIMRKNVNDEFIIEIETNAERVTILPENIHQFFENKDVDGQFTLEYKHKGHFIQQEIYKTKDCKKLLKTLKNFVHTAKESSGKSKKTGEGKEKKNLISEVASFFGA